MFISNFYINFYLYALDPKQTFNNLYIRRKRGVLQLLYATGFATKLWFFSCIGHFAIGLQLGDNSKICSSNAQVRNESHEA